MWETTDGGNTKTYVGEDKALTPEAVTVHLQSAERQLDVAMSTLCQILGMPEGPNEVTEQRPAIMRTAQRVAFLSERVNEMSRMVREQLGAPI